MKSIISLAVGALVASSALAQEVVQIKATILKRTDKKPVTEKPCYIEVAHDGRLFYRKTPNAVDITPMRINAAGAIFMVRPTEFIEAVELFENRKYELALKKFLEVKEKYKRITDIPGSFPAQAGLYELDCYRKLRQFSKLAEKEKVFAKGKFLKKESQQQQLAIYKLWRSLNDKEYPLIIKQYEDNWRAKKLPNYLRAQLEYVYGKALEAQNRSGDALIAYAKAMNADFAASEAISISSLEASFQLIEKDKEAQTIRGFWDKNDKDNMKNKVNTAPFRRLVEASALVKVHDKLGLSGFNEEGEMIKLNPKYAAYAKYTKKAGEKFAEE